MRSSGLMGWYPPEGVHDPETEQEIWNTEP